MVYVHDLPSVHRFLSITESNLLLMIMAAAVGGRLVGSFSQVTIDSVGIE